MSWGISTNGVAMISGFADAKKYYETTVDVRGKPKADHGVPLQLNRRNLDTKSLHKLDDDRYAARLYLTDCVVWHRDGSMTLDLSYGSMSTDKFIDHFLYAAGAPFVASTPNHQIINGDRSKLEQSLKQQIEHENVPSKIPNRPIFVSKGLITIKPCNSPLEHRWKVEGWQRAYGRYVDKSGAHEIRKAYKPLFDYLKVFKSYPMADHTTVIDEFKKENVDKYAPYDFGKQIDEAVAKNPHDESLWAVFAALAHVPRHGHWHYPEHERYVLKDMQAIKRHVYELAYQQSNLYSNTELPLGYLVRGWNFGKETN